MKNYNSCKLRPHDDKSKLKVTIYRDVRLPEDMIMSNFYMRFALDLKFKNDRPCEHITTLELHRLKLKLR